MTKIRTRAVAATTTVFAALGLAACGGEVSGERAGSGRNFEAHVEVTDTRYRSSLELPTGRLTVGLDVLPALKVDDPDDPFHDKSLLAPRSGSFVRVAWSLDSARSADRVLDGEYGYPRRDFDYGFDSLRLFAGGVRYLLSAGDGDSRGSTTWTVGGDVRDLRVEAVYDGVVQSVDPRTGKRRVGRAAPLYDAPAPRTGACGTPSAAAPFSLPTEPPASEEPFACRYQVRRLGYVFGRGWAPRGQEWLVVDVDLEHGDEMTLVKAGRRINYTDRSFSDTAEAALSGQAGKPARGEYRSSDYGHTLYFAVSPKAALPHTLPVRQTLGVVVTADLDKRDRPREDLDLTWTVPLR